MHHHLPTGFRDEVEHRPGIERSHRGGAFARTGVRGIALEHDAVAAQPGLQALYALDQAFDRRERRVQVVGCDLHRDAMHPAAAHPQLHDGAAGRVTDQHQLCAADRRHRDDLAVAYSDAFGACIEHPAVADEQPQLLRQGGHRTLKRDLGRRRRR